MSNGSTITRLQRSLGGPISREAIRLVAILSHLVFIRGTAFVKGKTGNPCVFLLRLPRRVVYLPLTTPDLSSEAVIHLTKERLLDRDWKAAGREHDETKVEALTRLGQHTPEDQQPCTKVGLLR